MGVGRSRSSATDTATQCASALCADTSVWRCVAHVGARVWTRRSAVARGRRVRLLLVFHRGSWLTGPSLLPEDSGSVEKVPYLVSAGVSAGTSGPEGVSACSRRGNRRLARAWRSARGGWLTRTRRGGARTRGGFEHARRCGTQCEHVRARSRASTRARRRTDGAYTGVRGVCRGVVRTTVDAGRA